MDLDLNENKQELIDNKEKVERDDDDDEEYQVVENQDEDEENIYENNGQKSIIQFKRRRNLADIERQLAILKSELESDLFNISMIKKELKSTKKSTKELKKTIKKKRLVKKEIKKLAQSFNGLNLK